jgi:hypothetical protein
MDYLSDFFWYFGIGILRIEQRLFRWIFFLGGLPIELLVPRLFLLCGWAWSGFPKSERAEILPVCCLFSIPKPTVFFS